MKVRELSLTERLALEGAVKADPDNAVQAIVIAGVCDDDGALLFTAADALLLGATSATALLAVVTAVKKINGLSQDDVEQLAKNSEASQDADSHLGSQHVLA